MNGKPAMSGSPIYFDYNATTPCDPQVVERMLPYFGQWYGNPANGLHVQGRRTARAVDVAREQIATLINAQPGEILFTAGATESNNLSILGYARMSKSETRNRIVTCAIEHKAVLLPCKHLQSEGCEVIVLPVDAQGRVSLDSAAEAINDKTLLVSIHLANNEIGTLQPIAEIAALAHAHGARVHCDAAQAVGKVPVDVQALGVDLLSMSAHKLYGPKGIGVLYVRSGPRSLPLEPLMYGGGQESGLRSGTSNVPAIVGLGEACRLAKDSVDEESVRLAVLRDLLEDQLLSSIPALKFNGRQAERLPNTSSIVFPHVDADALLLNLPNIMMGTGSACTAGAIEPSHVLTAMGLSREEASSTIRVSMGRYTTEEEIQHAVNEIVSAYSSLTS